MNMLLLNIILLTTFSIYANAQNYKSVDSFLNIPDQYIVFNDESALTKKHTLQSKQYNDFIHNLYRYDADNLQKFENLYTPRSTGAYNRHKRNVLSKFYKRSLITKGRP